MTEELDDEPRKAREDDDAQDSEETGDESVDDGEDEVPDDEAVEPRSGVTQGENLAEIDHLRAEIDKERARTAEMKDALVRTAADFDNFRKRMERDRVEERKQATSSVVKSLLPVLDGVGRALMSAGNTAGNPELHGFVEGIRMVQVQLLDVLKQAGLEPIPTDGIFDPALHEALMQEASDVVPNMTILDVFEPGYRLGGRLLRPARVKVAFNPGGSQADSGSDGDGTED